MGSMNPQVIVGQKVGHATPASSEAARIVWNADPRSDDGRSPWLWVWLEDDENGPTVLLACAPQGDTYAEVEDDLSEGGPVVLDRSVVLSSVLAPCATCKTPTTRIESLEMVSDNDGSISVIDQRRCEGHGS